MPLNLTVSPADAYQAFGNLDTKKLLQSVAAGFDQTTGLPLTRPAVDISPPATTESASRRITWDLNMQIAESDEDDYEEFAEVVKKLIDGGQAISAQALSTQMGVPLDGAGIVDNIVRTMRGIENVLEEAKITSRLSIDNLKVGLAGRNALPVTLTARVFVEAFWITDDPDDAANKAWIEVESFKIGTIVDARSSPNRWDASTWNPLKAVPRGHQGRTFMEPHGEDDRTGDMKTEPGDRPRPAIMAVTASPINEDQTTVTVNLSANAQADDTVIMLIKRVRLELEAAVPGQEEPPKSEKGSAQPKEDETEKSKAGKKGIKTIKSTKGTIKKTSGKKSREF